MISLYPCTVRSEREARFIFFVGLSGERDGLHVKIDSGLGQELGVRGKVRNRIGILGAREEGSWFGFWILRERNG